MGHNSERRRLQAGFTLLELLVNVAMLGILAAIAVATYGQFLRRAYEANAMHYMRSWPAAQEMYWQTYGHYADADEQLQTIGILKVPTKIPYDFSIDSGSSATTRWWGRATPTKSGLRYFYIDHRGYLVWGSTGPPAAPP